MIGALLAAGEPAEIVCKGDRVWILEPSLKSKKEIIDAVPEEPNSQGE